ASGFILTGIGRAFGRAMTDLSEPFRDRLWHAVNAAVLPEQSVSKRFCEGQMGEICRGSEIISNQGQVRLATLRGNEPNELAEKFCSGRRTAELWIGCEPGKELAGAFGKRTENGRPYPRVCSVAFGQPG